MHLSILNVMPDEDCVCTYTKIYQKLIMDFFSISEQLLTTEDVHDVRSLLWAEAQPTPDLSAEA